MAAAVRQVLERVPGLLAVVVTDKDGAVVAQAAVEGFSADSIPRYILAKAAEVLDTTTKLGAGNAVASLADYDNLKIAYAESHQLVIHLIGSKEANSGLMLEMHDEVVYKLRPLMSSFPQQ
eukprot:m.199330 g.199330  ORF g.199330 m.199330 type:complete len:121 (+) comp20720_c0_seq1:41-403(+)